MCSQFQPKACSGRCQSNGNCSSKKTSRCWVVAACGGSITVLEKSTQPATIGAEGAVVFSAPAEFTDYLNVAGEREAFDQLVVVGSSNDLAWISALIPATLNNRIVAEIAYPLMQEWLHEPGLMQLSAALTPLMK